MKQLSWVLLLFLGLAPAQAQPPKLAPEALAQLKALYEEKAGWSAVERKIDSNLLLEMKRQRGDPLFDQLPGFSTATRVRADGSVLVDLQATVTPGLLSEIVARGGRVEASVPRFGHIRAVVPLAELESLAAADEVRSIHRPLPTLTSSVEAANLTAAATGSVTSEGDVAHAADTSRTAFSVDGSGVTVGVLGNGIDSAGARVATGDLPVGLTALPGQLGSGDVGTAALEIIHDLAPGADLQFATILGGHAAMAQNILDLATAGSDILVIVGFYVGEPVFQDGVIAQAIETVSASGVLVFSVAGNNGNLTDGSGVYEADFRGVVHDFPGPPGPDVEITHDFGGPQPPEVFNRITADVPSFLILQWSDFVGESGNDYDLWVFDEFRLSPVRGSLNRQDGDDSPFEFIDLSTFPAKNEHVVIIRFSGEDRYFHVNTFGGRLQFASDGQIAGHRAAESGFAVASVNVAQAGGGVFIGGIFNQVDNTSSDGPRKIFFEADGTPITPGNFSSTGGTDRLKPEIAAASVVSTATYGTTNFLGTFAAAPHAGALAALVQQNGNLTPAGMRQIFAASALDIEVPGPDNESGSGIIMADRLLATTHPISASCAVDSLSLTGDPNDGPQTFRACLRITWGDGSFHDVTGLAPEHIFTDGFESGDVSSWSNTVP